MRRSLLPAVAAVALTVTMAGRPAFADRDGSTVKRLARLIPAAQYIVGVAHDAHAVAKFKEHKDNPKVHGASAVDIEEPTPQSDNPPDLAEPEEP